MDFPANWFIDEIVEIHKTFHFEAAHALDGYEGKCKNIHGHSYVLEISVRGKVNQDTTISASGMVLDFGDLKKLVQEYILPLYDHCLLLRKDSRFKELVQLNEKLRFVDFQPTCENMLLEIVWILKSKLPSHVELSSCLLRETNSSFATWRSI
jgi:6-pyruvoyltetrahydropterin/6-carboxytetrahydropterin synthase